MKTKLPRGIIKKYDIRGIVETDLVTTNVVGIGFLFAKYVKSLGFLSVAVGYDERSSSIPLAQMIEAGITHCGLCVRSVGHIR